MALVFSAQTTCTSKCRTIHSWLWLSICTDQRLQIYSTWSTCRQAEIQRCGSFRCCSFHRKACLLCWLWFSFYAQSFTWLKQTTANESQRVPGLEQFITFSFEINNSSTFVFDDKLYDQCFVIFLSLQLSCAITTTTTSSPVCLSTGAESDMVKVR